MNPRERIMAALSWGWPDYVPWGIKPNHLPRGAWERRLRNMGLGLTVEHSVYHVEMRDVEVLERRAGNYVERTYRTPVGEVSDSSAAGSISRLTLIRFTLAILVRSLWARLSLLDLTSSENGGSA